MPITKSAIKKMRQDEKNTVRNRRTKDNLKEILREFADAVNEGKSEKELSELLRKAYKSIDMAAKKNLIHKNNAARQKSSLAKMISSGK